MSGAEFGDVRLSRRLGKIVETVQRAPDQSFPSLFDDGQLEGAYRFFNNEAVTPDAILAPHASATVARMADDKKVALLLDKASGHTAQSSADLAAELDIEMIWLPTRATNINPMDRLWNWGKDKICADKQYLSIDSQADRFIQYSLGLSPQEALRKAGILSGRFWLFR